MPSAYDVFNILILLGALKELEFATSLLVSYMLLPGIRENDIHPHQLAYVGAEPLAEPLKVGSTQDKVLVSPDQRSANLILDDPDTNFAVLKAKLVQFLDSATHHHMTVI